MSSLDPAQQLHKLFAMFAGQLSIEVPGFEVIDGDQVPLPYRDLLVHSHHMTVTLERYHGRRVELQVIAKRHQGKEYGRMILLKLEGTEQVVEFGIFRMDLSCCGQAVQDEIVAGIRPLGRILIEHDVLRRIDPIAFLKIAPIQQLMTWFGCEETTSIYGRLASISSNEIQAIELLEIVRPEPTAV